MVPAKFSTIAHRHHLYCNPIDPDLLDRVVARLALGSGQHVLDVGCGKGTLLIRIAERFGASGTGVDLNGAFLDEGRARARRLGVDARVQLLAVDATRFVAQPGSFDAGICIGSTHALGTYRDTLRHLAGWVRPGGHILAGEGFWARDPDPEYLERLGAAADDMTTHEGNAEVGAGLGLAPRGSWTSGPRDWDAYEELYARTMETYVATHPEDPDAAPMREQIARWRETYRRWGRDTLGFGLYLFARP